METLVSLESQRHERVDGFLGPEVLATRAQRLVVGACIAGQAGGSLRVDAIELLRAPLVGDVVAQSVHVQIQLLVHLVADRIDVAFQSAIANAAKQCNHVKATSIEAGD